MRKLNGHVLQPVMEQAQKELKRELPPYWTVQSVRTPSLTREMGRIRGAFEKLSERLVGKIDRMRRRSGVASGKDEVREQRPHLAWEMDTMLEKECKQKLGGKEHAVTEEELKFLRKQWGIWTISRIDQYQGVRSCCVHSSTWRAWRGCPRA